MSITHVAFYPSDWLAGTRGMSDAETGVYITLICRMYEMAGPIERDDDRLSRLCGCKTKSRFVKSLNYLLSEGKVVETESGIFNERVSKEIQKVVEKSKKGREAAESRWQRKHNKINGTVNADASSGHMPRTCQSEPESEPLDKDKESLSMYASDFEEWWKSEYPERKGTQGSKPQSKAIYIRNRKAGVTREQISKATQEYFDELWEAERVGTEFVKQTTTWLNGKFWEND